MLDAEDIARANAAFAAIPLSEIRRRELPIELAQFAAVIKRVRERLVFEEEPAAFLTTLSACAQQDM